MPNFRVFYPLHYIAIGPYCSASGTPVHGVQSLGSTTSFNLEQVFELGQLDIYENIENLPDIEITVERVMDGYPLMYELATSEAVGTSLLNKSNERCDIILSIFSDSQDNASGTALVQAYCSGMYIGSLNYNLPVQGNCTESLTFVGNDKSWGGTYFQGHFDGTDSPADQVQRRQHVMMGSGQSNWPNIIPGIAGGYNPSTAGEFGAHIQDVTISVNLGREDLFELGRRKPYYKYATFPTAVDCTINVIAAGNEPGDMVNASSDAESNLTDEKIRIVMDDGTVFDLGTKNKLNSVTSNGGDTGGEVLTYTYSFQNFNFLVVTSPQ